ncbi:hypothetical protein evm_003375 [Chilo suppressalis]|nr:hypothetical protein evm_003375 [Chilo suppressalis]
MTHEIDCKFLIKAVEKRTPLYDTSIKEYRDRKLKKKLWNEVYQEVYSPSVWNLMSIKDKTKYEKEVQKRWSSLRHCFRRELSVKKNMPSDGPVKKKKKYLYFDSLSFLLPFMEIDNTEGLYTNENNETENNETELSNLDNITSPAETKFSKQRTDNKNNDEEIITLLKEGNKILSKSKTSDSGQDEDELFLRSLTSYMKEFSGDQKLLLRMEIIKSILNFKQSLNESPNFCHVNVTPDVEIKHQEDSPSYL